MKTRKPAENRHSALIETIFSSRYQDGLTEVPFHRDELTTTAKKLRITLPKNLGDVISPFATGCRCPTPSQERSPQDRSG